MDRCHIRKKFKSKNSVSKVEDEQREEIKNRFEEETHLYTKEIWSRMTFGNIPMLRKLLLVKLRRVLLVE